MNFRTDLALEKRENIDSGEIDGVISEKEEKNNVTVTTIYVTNENGSKALGKPVGRYITLEVTPFMKNSDLSDGRIEVFSEKLLSLLPNEGTVLVAGLGNESITPDALGPRCVSLLLATRHIKKELAKSIGLSPLRPVAGIVPGVLGKTGIETSEIIEAVCERIKPCALIVIDALASRKLSRLGTTVQMTDTGISPGSGVGNTRSEISERKLGIPVVAVGVPTVVDGATMAFDLLENAGLDGEKLLKSGAFSKETPMMVTPKEIDLVIERAAMLISMGINSAMQPLLSLDDIIAIVK